MKGVKDLKIEYWDESREVGDNAWVRTWFSHENELEPLLPAVRITLELEMPDEGEPIRYMTVRRRQTAVNVIGNQVQASKMNQRSQRGVALLLVVVAITLLSVVLLSFRCVVVSTYRLGQICDTKFGRQPLQIPHRSDPRLP